MTLIEIYLYQSCNLKCKDCPMAAWLYEPDDLDRDGFKRNAITNDLLIPWMQQHLDPKECFIEFTGGEPGMYPEIGTLIPKLEELGFRGIIRTNGTLPIPETKSFKRVAAWHKDTPFPISFDHILILENPEDDWQSKERHCQRNGISYDVFPYKFFSTDHRVTTNYPIITCTIFDKMSTMFSSGVIVGCFSGRGSAKRSPSLLKNSPPVNDRFCPTCGNMRAVECFINGIPGFKEEQGIKDMEVNPAYDIPYPLLNSNNEWVDKDGNVLGRMGEWNPPQIKRDRRM